MDLAVSLFAANTVPSPASLADGVVLMIVGMGVVFASLCVLLLLISALRRVSERTAAEAQPDGDAPLANVDVDEGVTPELVAVLTAAATAAVDRPLRIRKVRIASTAPGAAWLSGGRAALMATRKPKRTRR